MRINIKRYSQFVTYIDIKFPQTIFAKYAEHTTLGILLVSFNNKILSHPLRACSS